MAAHIDSRKGSPGAVDNATGVAALLGLAELLGDHADGPSIELVPFNGEDYYAAPGQKAWLLTNEGRLGDIVLALNIDDAGLAGFDTHVSFYECSEQTVSGVLGVITAQPGFAQGPRWFQGDHAMLAMNGVPSVALASAGMHEFMARQAHSALDTLDLADAEKVAQISHVLRQLIRRMSDERPYSEDEHRPNSF